MQKAYSRSAGVTAAAMLAILGSCSALLVWGYFFLSILNAPPDGQGKHLYDIFPLHFALLGIVPPMLVALGIRTGIGLFQLRPWARVAAMSGASIALVFSLATIAFRPFETFFIPEAYVSDLQSLKQLIAISFIVMLMPISVWWLFFFRFKSVKMQFLSPGAGQSLSGQV